MLKIRLLVIFLLAIGYWLSPSNAYAQEEWSGDCVIGDVATIRGIECLMGNGLSVALQFLGLVFFIMFIFGGIKYLTSGGEPKAVDSAKGTLTGAFAGLILAILAWFILRLVQDITGVQVTMFKWPFSD